MAAIPQSQIQALLARTAPLQPQQQIQPVNLGHPMPAPRPMQLQPVNLGQQGDMTGMHFSDPAQPNAPVLDSAPQMMASQVRPLSKEKM